MIMKIAGLYAIVDTTFMKGSDPVLVAQDYLRGGGTILQLRDKNRNASPSTLASFQTTASKISGLKKDFNFIFIVNDDLEAASQPGVDGIHVGRDDPTIEECRAFLGKEKIIGYSSHSVEEAIEAEKRGADYVAFGAIFPSSTKGSGHPVQGLDRLKKVVQSLKVPVVAIGGIHRENIQRVLSTGVAAVAMISALANAKDRVEETRFYDHLFKSLLPSFQKGD